MNVVIVLLMSTLIILILLLGISLHWLNRYPRILLVINKAKLEQLSMSEYIRKAFLKGVVTLRKEVSYGERKLLPE